MTSAAGDGVIFDSVSVSQCKSSPGNEVPRLNAQPPIPRKVLLPRATRTSVDQPACALHAMYAKMAMSAKRATRPAPIMRECATCRVPFGLMPVTAAAAARSTAIPSHTIQFMSTLDANGAPPATRGDELA